VPSKQYSVKRIRDEKDYKTGGNSDFISLDEGEKFLGYFLGEADETIDDPAFFPYQVHWINGGSVPCAGDDCPFCEDGDRPRAKAMTLWLITEDEKGTEFEDGKLMIWDMPVSAIKQFRELRAEGDEIKGRLFRVKRSDEKTYVVMPKVETITKTATKAALKDAPDLEAMLTAKLRKALEGVAVARAMNDDDDDDDDTPARGKSSGAKVSSSKGKGKAAEPDDDDDDDAPEPDEEMPEEASSLEVVVTKVSDENWIMVKYGDNDAEKVWGTPDVDVTELVKGQVIAISYVTDEDDDKVLTEDPEEAPESEENNGADLPDSLEEVEFEITKIDEDDQTFDVENDELSFTLYFLDKGPASKIDFDDYSVGDKIIVTAEKDATDDMVATQIPEKVEAKKRTTKGTGTTKGAATKKSGAKSGAKRATRKR